MAGQQQEDALQQRTPRGPQRQQGLHLRQPPALLPNTITTTLSPDPAQPAGQTMPQLQAQVCCLSGLL